MHHASKNPRSGGALPRGLRALLLLATLLLTACAQRTVHEAEDWNRLFQGKEGFGWAGGDAAYSVSLPGDRILWLFGDSYLGDVRAGVRTDVQLRFGNTIAIQRSPAPGAAPDPSDLVFDWGAADTNGWLPLDRSILVAPFAPASGRRALEQELPLMSWPLHGIVVGRDLVLFHVPVTPYACTDCQFGAFKTHGTVASIVRGVDRPYEQWGFRSGDGWLPGREPSTRIVPHSRAAPELDDPDGTLWGTFVARDEAEPGTIYVYGFRQAGDARSLVIARVTSVARADDLLDFARWTFWTGDGWVASADAATPIAHDVAAEVSVTRVPESQGGGYALVHSGALDTGEIAIALARRPWGPFETRYRLAIGDCAVGGFTADRRHLSYAAKAHPWLTTDDVLLISVVTAPAPGTIDTAFITRPDQYVPRFVEVPWDEIRDHERSSPDRCGDGAATAATE